MLALVLWEPHLRTLRLSIPDILPVRASATRGGEFYSCWRTENLSVLSSHLHLFLYREFVTKRSQRIDCELWLLLEVLFGGMDSAQDQEVTPELWRQGLALAACISHVKAPG